MIPQDFIQSLLGRVDIVDVIDRYVKLKKSGANYSACCPFHNEKTPSFSVSPTKQFYHCFGCGVHGNAIGFLMEYSGQSYPDAIRSLAETVGMPVPEVKGRDRPVSAQAQGLAAQMMDALGYYRAELKKSPVAIEYLKKRGLSGEIAARYGLGYAPDGWQNLEAVFSDYKAAALKDTGLVIDNEQGKRYDRFRDRVMFPILDSRGNVIGFGGRVIGPGEPKYLNSPETPLFEKGRELYGLYQARRSIRDANRVVVVEGYMDVVALAQHGVENAVATLGTATTPVHVTKLLRLADDVVFCFDGDNAGRKAAWRALEVSLPVLADGKAVSFLFLPPEDDPDTFVRAHGRDAFVKELDAAKPLSKFLLGELASRVDMKTEEGRARFLAEARPLVSKIAAPALAALVRQRIAEMSGLTPQDIAALVPREAVAPAPAAAAAPRGARRGEPKSSPSAAQWRRIVGLLVNHPELALQVELPTGGRVTPDRAEVRSVLGRIQEAGAGVTPAMALEIFRGLPEEEIVTTSSSGIAQELSEGDFDPWPEVSGYFRRWVEEEEEEELRQLFVLIQRDEAGPEAKARYGALLQARQHRNEAPESQSKS
jgi:DNA primase